MSLSLRLAGVGVKAVSAFSPRFPLVFPAPLLISGFLNFPARRLSQVAKNSPLARKYGSAARVGGQRSAGRRSRFLPPAPVLPFSRLSQSPSALGNPLSPAAPGASMPLLFCGSPLIPRATLFPNREKISPRAEVRGVQRGLVSSAPPGRRSRFSFSAPHPATSPPKPVLSNHCFEVFEGAGTFSEKVPARLRFKVF